MGGDSSTWEVAYCLGNDNYCWYQQWIWSPVWTVLLPLWYQGTLSEIGNRIAEVKTDSERQVTWQQAAPATGKGEGGERGKYRSRYGWGGRVGESVRGEVHCSLCYSHLGTVAGSLSNLRTSWRPAVVNSFEMNLVFKDNEHSQHMRTST